MQTKLFNATKAIELRDYQKEMVGNLYQHIREGRKRILLIALMGTGKTIISSWVMRDAVNRNKRCVFLCPYTVLIDQTIETLEMLGVHCTGLQGGRKVDESAPVIVASMQTITARLRGDRTLEDILGHQDLMFVDEAHITAFNKRYPELQDWIIGNHGCCVGMTATPWRLSRKQWLGQRFDVTVEGPQPPDVVKMGSVVPCRGFTIGSVFDIENLRTVKGDFAESDMSSQATRPAALKHVVNEWKRIANDRPTVMIGTTVEQAKKTADAFESEGVSTAIITGATPLKERQAIFEQVKAGDVQMICSVGCLTAGFNLPCIGAVLYVRATKSKALFFQSAGRACRTMDGKVDSLLLDFGGNLKRFGNPMSYQDYDIGEKEQFATEAITKTCPACNAEVNSFASVCPECGHVFGIDEETPDLILARLTEYVDKITKDKIAFIRKARRNAFLERTSPDAPIEEFVEKYGHPPSPDWLSGACLTRRSPTQASIDRFMGWLTAVYSGHKQWQRSWLDYHIEAEFGTDDIKAIQGKRWTEILELPHSASWEQIQSAYRQKLLSSFSADAALQLSDAMKDATEQVADKAA